VGKALIRAASICLLDRSGQRVLLGRRRAPPSAGSWAFPGGRSRPGETALQTGIRELAEETGIRLRHPRATATHTVLAGRPARFRVTCVVVEIDEAPDPRPGPEMRARWIGLREAAALRPMTTGTRRVLRELS
jgi:8-oxo-dGTP pyrophosphatase MutT (NUDIX family)